MSPGGRRSGAKAARRSGAFGCVAVAPRHTAVPASSAPSSVSRQSAPCRRAVDLSRVNLRPSASSDARRQVDAIQRQAASEAPAPGAAPAGPQVERKPIVEVERCDISADPETRLLGVRGFARGLAEQHQRSIDRGSLRADLPMQQQSGGGTIARPRSDPRSRAASRRSMRNADLSVVALRNGAGRSMAAPCSDDSTVHPICRSRASSVSCQSVIPLTRSQQRNIVFAADELHVGGSGAGDSHAASLRSRPAA